jgi:choline kinase
MKAVILCAGSATRLRPLTTVTPKPLLPVAGRPLLRRAIENLLAAGLEELVLVTGYLEDQIHAAVRAWFPGLRVACITNAVYETTNNAYSLRLARPFVDGRPFMLLDGDIVFDVGVLHLLRRHAATSSLALRPDPDIAAEEVKVRIDARGRVAAIGKEVPVHLAAGESVGIELFTAAASARLFEALEERVGRRGLINEYYEASFQDIVDTGTEICAIDIGDLHAMEIDSYDDLVRAEAISARLAARARVITQA